MTSPSQEPQPSFSQEAQEPVNTVPTPQGAGQHPQAPYVTPPQQQYQQPPQQRWNVWAIAGFIVSFFAGIIGIVLSVIGVVQVRRNREKGQGLAIAGIVIGALRVIAAIIMSIIFAMNFANGTLVVSGGEVEYSPSSSNSAPAPSQSSSPSTTAPSSPSTSAPSQQQYYDDDFYDDFSNDLDAFDDDLIADLEDMPGRFSTLEEYMNQTGVKNQLEAMSARMPNGLKMQVSAQDNTMTYRITLTQATGSQAKAAANAIHAEFADDMHEQVYEWKRALKGNPSTTAKLIVTDRKSVV